MTFPGECVRMFSAYVYIYMHIYLAPTPSKANLIPDHAGFGCTGNTPSNLNGRESPSWSYDISVVFYCNTAPDHMNHT